jgi:hypothetical protein
MSFFKLKKILIRKIHTSTCRYQIEIINHFLVIFFNFNIFLRKHNIGNINTLDDYHLKVHIAYY